MILGVCYAMVRTLYDEPLWPRALALLSGMWGVATVVGPALGGGLARSWRVAFAPIVVMALAFAAAAMLLLPRSVAELGRARVQWRELGFSRARSSPALRAVRSRTCWRAARQRCEDAEGGPLLADALPDAIAAAGCVLDVRRDGLPSRRRSRIN